MEVLPVSASNFRSFDGVATYVSLSPPLRILSVSFLYIFVVWSETFLEKKIHLLEHSYLCEAGMQGSF